LLPLRAGGTVTRRSRALHHFLADARPPPPQTGELSGQAIRTLIVSLLFNHYLLTIKKPNF
jgi:hypothetical protein